MGNALIVPGAIFVAAFAATVVLTNPPRMGWDRPSIDVIDQPEPTETVQPEPFARAADPGYRNCTEAHAAGRYSIPVGDPEYRARMDGDRDGFACEPIPPGRRSGRTDRRVRVFR